MKGLKSAFEGLLLTDEQISALKAEYAAGKRTYTLSRELFDEYKKSGNRLLYENEYFSKRKRMGILFMLSTAAPEQYTDELSDMLLSICSEPFWALPAHIDCSFDDPSAAEIIDLFAAETGQTLAEIKYLIGDRLPEALNRRISDEIRRRIIRPFWSKPQAWEQSKSNWSAVCGGCVGLVLLYEQKELYDTYAERFDKIFSAYLDGFLNDGACTEGLGYWSYGFGYFMYFMLACDELSAKQPALDVEKLRRIAKFQQNMYLTDGVTVSFSDSGRNERYISGLATLLREYYGEDICLPNPEYSAVTDNCRRFAHMLRSYLYTCEHGDAAKNDGVSFYPNSQWYINRRREFSLAAKGGNNGESHNHNDIGSFILAADGEQIIADFGAGEYTGDYFTDKRYTHLCCSSEGHSVPMIDERTQLPGTEYRAENAAANAGSFALDISGAYGIDELKSLNRSFSVSDSLTVTDKGTFSDSAEHTVRERFVSLIPPEVDDDAASISGFELSAPYTPVISQKSLNDHDGVKKTMYFIDYVFNCRGSFEFSVEIKKRRC